jgi:hypothetical protein
VPQKLLEAGNAAWSTEDVLVHTDRHHPRRGRPFPIETVKVVAAVTGKILGRRSRRS